MRTLLAAVAAFGLTCEARAVDVLAGGPAVDFGIYSVSASAPEVVGVTSAGNNLLATTLTVTNTTGDSNLHPGAVFDSVIGSNGALHHEQAPNTILVLSYPTPLASSFFFPGGRVSQVSNVDSHYLFDGHITFFGDDPAETFSTVPSGVPVEVLDDVGITTAQTGFGGVLTGEWAFPTTAPSQLIAYLAFEDRGPSTAIDFTMVISNSVKQRETLTGFIRIPEPASALLAGVTVLGTASLINLRSRR